MNLKHLFGCGLLLAAIGLAASVKAAPTAVGVNGPGGGELTTADPPSTAVELESNFEVGPDSAQKAQKAVTFGGCVAPYTVISHRLTLPAFRSFLHRVVPDRRGFNVVMTIDYPGLFRRVNNYGPGRAEAFTVRTPYGRVAGRVRISGVGGSYGCYTFRVTP
jgi:hypothetical protein